MKEGLKSKLLDIVYKGELLRTTLDLLCEQHPAKQSAGERRMRELCEEYPIIPVTKKGVPVTEGNSFLIHKWVWRVRKPKNK